MCENFESAGQTSLSNSHSELCIPDTLDCMRCGMCVNYCPAYKVAPQETESPRQRVAILRRLLQQQILPTAQEQQQLQHCLQCRTCETVCPSQMRFGKLYDAGLVSLQQQQRPGWLENLAFTLIEHKTLRRWLMPLISLYLRLGIQPWLRRSKLLAYFKLQAAEALVQQPALLNLAKHYPARTAKTRGRVALFTGCLAENFDRDTLMATIKVLTQIGFEVIVPPQQGCCGALHQHSGRSAQTLINHNLAVFYGLEVDAIIHTASGCGAMLAEYQSNQLEQLAWFGSKLTDINDFLLAHWPEHLQLTPLPLTVAVHEPCSQRNILNNADTVYALLKHIPALECIAMPDNGTCCGAGGSYLLRQPQKAAQLKNLKLHALSTIKADRLVTTNFGCALHLNNNLATTAAKFIHPVSLLANQLPQN